MSNLTVFSNKWQDFLVIVAFSKLPRLTDRWEGLSRENEMCLVPSHLPASTHRGLGMFPHINPLLYGELVTTDCHSNFRAEKLTLGLRRSSEKSTYLACLGSGS